MNKIKLQLIYKFTYRFIYIAYTLHTFSLEIDVLFIELNFNKIFFSYCTINDAKEIIV
jgi:hypothetical protein